jgi:hypothetical protein
MRAAGPRPFSSPPQAPLIGYLGLPRGTIFMQKTLSFLQSALRSLMPRFLVICMLLCFAKCITCLKCQPWLVAYVRFHAEHANDPNATTLTVYQRGQMTLGFGDMFREFLWGLRYAAATKRVFFISSLQAPLPLDFVFAPTDINWTVPSHLKNSVEGGKFVNSAWLSVTDPENYAGFQHLLTDQNNFADQEVWRNNTLRHLDVDARLDSADLHCVWKSLFRPTDKVLRLLQNQRPYEGPYTGIHVRSAGMLGEMTGVVRGDPVRMLVGSLYCAAHFGLPVFVVASDIHFRRAVRAGVFPNALGPSEEWALYAGHNRENVTGHMQTMAELAALADARCLVVSCSGFSDIARWWGGQTCIRYVGIPPNIWGADYKTRVATTSTECFLQMTSGLSDDQFVPLNDALAQFEEALLQDDHETQKRMYAKILALALPEKVTRTTR